MVSIVERLNLPAGLPEPEGVRSRAAVAVVFGPGDEVLFIRRAERPGDPWSGDMAFPGGRASPDDLSTRHTAERETWEEVGLDLRDARYVGALPVQRSPLRDPIHTFGVFPYVFQVGRWPAFAPSDEVASVHRFTFPRFLAGEGRACFRYVGWGIERDMPCVTLDGARIWGLTLRMLDDLLDTLRDPGLDARLSPVTSPR